MLIEFVAAVAVGFGAFGLAMLARRLTGNRLPRFVPPAAAGIGIIAFTIYGEYAWFGRTAAALPEGVEVARTAGEPAWFRPWTYAAPFVNRFSAVDVASARTNEALPGQVMVDLYLLARHTPTRKVRLLVDCVDGRQAVLPPDVSFDADGTPEGVDWVPIGRADPVRSIVCREV